MVQIGTQVIPFGELLPAPAQSGSISKCRASWLRSTVEVAVIGFRAGRPLQSTRSFFASRCKVQQLDREYTPQLSVAPGKPSRVQKPLPRGVQFVDQEVIILSGGHHQIIHPAVTTYILDTSEPLLAGPQMAVLVVKVKRVVHPGIAVFEV